MRAGATPSTPSTASPRWAFSSASWAALRISTTGLPVPRSSATLASAASRKSSAVQSRRGLSAQSGNCARRAIKAALRGSWVAWAAPWAAAFWVAPNASFNFAWACSRTWLGSGPSPFLKALLALAKAL